MFMLVNSLSTPVSFSILDKAVAVKTNCCEINKQTPQWRPVCTDCNCRVYSTCTLYVHHSLHSVCRELILYLTYTFRTFLNMTIRSYLLLVDVVGVQNHPLDKYFAIQHRWETKPSDKGTPYDHYTVSTELLHNAGSVAIL